MCRPKYIPKTRRPPMLELEYEASLLPFEYQRPAFTPLLQLPPTLSTTPTSRTTHPKILTAEAGIFIEEFLKILASAFCFAPIHISIFFCCYTHIFASRKNCKLRFVIFYEKFYAGRTAVLPYTPLKGVCKQDARRCPSPSTKRR